MNQPHGQVGLSAKRGPQVLLHLGGQSSRVFTRWGRVASCGEGSPFAVHEGHRADVRHAKHDIEGGRRPALTRLRPLWPWLRRCVRRSQLRHRRGGAIEPQANPQRAFGKGFAASQSPLDPRRYSVRFLRQTAGDALHRRARRRQPVSGRQRAAVLPHVAFRVPLGDAVRQRWGRPFHQACSQRHQVDRGAIAHALVPQHEAVHFEGPVEAVEGNRPRIGRVSDVDHAIHHGPLPEAFGNRLKLLLQELSNRLIGQSKRTRLSVSELPRGQSVPKGGLHLPDRRLRIGVGKHLVLVHAGHGPSFVGVADTSPLRDGRAAFKCLEITNKFQGIGESPPAAQPALSPIPTRARARREVALVLLETLGHRRDVEPAVEHPEGGALRGDPRCLDDARFDLRGEAGVRDVEYLDRTSFRPPITRSQASYPSYPPRF